MPRPPRIDFPDALYHVTSRGNGRATIFHSDADRERFLAQLADSLHTAAVVLHAYVLMDNHFHLLVHTPRGNLSRFMQRLCTAYAMYARYKHRRPGHQFQGRFKAKLVEDDVYLRVLSRYMHLNPVKTAAARRLDRRARLRLLNGYRWSSYSGYVDRKHVEEFVAYDVLNEFSADAAAARRQYRAFVEQCLLADDDAALRLMTASRYAIGGDRFVERTEAEIERRAPAAMLTATSTCRGAFCRSPQSTRPWPHTSVSSQRTWRGMGEAWAPRRLRPWNWPAG